jgi:hypothetical protein
VRGRLLLAGLALVSAGTLLVLLALDVGGWHAAMVRGDVRFAHDPGGRYPWAARTILPFGAGERLLGVRDDVAYRQGVRLFRLGQPRVAQPAAGAVRARSLAQTVLGHASGGDADLRRRSAEANLLGSLFLAGNAGTTDPAAREDFLTAANAEYAAAVILDPENDDAKYNLELTLVRRRAQRIVDRGQGATPGGSGHGAGLGRTGHGY